MAAANHSAAVLPNPGLCQESGSRRRESGYSIRWDEILTALWPKNTVKKFTGRTGTSPSYAERVLAGDRGLSMKTFLALIDAPDGGMSMLQALRAAGVDQPWVREFERAILRADTRRRIKELRQQLDRLDQADDA